MDLGSPEVLLLQGIHPGTGWTPRWLEACFQKLGPAGPEAQVILGCAGRTSASSCEVTNQLSWAEAETISPGTRESTSCYPLSHPLQRPLRSETLAKWSLGLPICGDEPKHIRPLKSLVTWDFARMEASDGCGPLSLGSSSQPPPLLPPGLISMFRSLASRAHPWAMKDISCISMQNELMPLRGLGLHSGRSLFYLGES